MDERRYKIMFEMTTGKIAAAQKVVIYGPEGVGKSTLAARFPKPLFIDTEGGTNKMDVARYPKPTSWEMLKNEVREAPATGCKTIIIDTIDWAEKLCIATICDASQKKGIEDFGYGKGYVYEREEFGRFLDLLQSIVDGGVNVVLTAHAQIRKFEQPDELGAYDRWELKLGQKTGSQISPIVKEWADMVLFCNYKTHTVVTDKDGKKRKAQGGERVMYTSHNPCWDAKNRDGLPEILPLAYEPIAHIFSDVPANNAPVQTTPLPASAPVQTPPPMPETLTPVQSEPTAPEIPDGIPKELADLMRQDNISDYEIQFVVSQEGYCPPDMPISAYPPEFIRGWIIPNWGMVREKARAADLDGVPF
jgi:hypothetical protein